MKITEAFDQEEILTILEAARVAMSDGDVFDMLARKMDISDEEMIKLREKITDYMK